MAVDDQYTVSLMHFDGNLNDESGKTWTAYGGATTSAAAAKFGSAGLVLDGVDDYLRVASSSDFDLTGTVTFECFISPNSVSGDRCIICVGPAGDGANSQGWALEVKDGKIVVKVGTSVFTGSATVSTSGKSHIAATFSATEIRTYLNGSFDTSFTMPTYNAVGSSYYVSIGGYSNDNKGTAGRYWWSGGIDEIRLSKTIRYTGSTYTVPTAPFGAQSLWLPQPIIFF